jgi:hypothetical protein
MSFIGSLRAVVMPKGQVAILLSGVLLLFAGCSQTRMGAEDSEVSASLPIRVVETGEGFAFFEGKEEVLFYQRKPKSLNGKYSRCHYIHPLYGLDGEILTEDFPSDHLHHRGIFWAWHQVFLGDKRVGDGWSLKDIAWDVYDVKTLSLDGGSPALKVKVFWKSPLWTDDRGEQKPFVKETAVIRVYPVRDLPLETRTPLETEKEKALTGDRRGKGSNGVYPASGDIRKIDFEISLLALEEGVRIGGANNKKAYGGFSARVRLPKDISFTGQGGAVTPAGTPIEAGPWLDFSGHFQEQGDVSGLAILCHRSLSGYPQRWILRRTGSMQNAVYPGREPIPLSREKPLVLRYRLVVHRGDAEHVELDKLQAQYNTECQQLTW